MNAWGFYKQIRSFRTKKGKRRLEPTNSSNKRPMRKRNSDEKAMPDVSDYFHENPVTRFGNPRENWLRSQARRNCLQRREEYTKTEALQKAQVLKIGGSEKKPQEMSAVEWVGSVLK